VTVAQVESTTLANASSIVFKALLPSGDSWPAVVAGWDLFGFWSPKVGSHSVCLTKEEPGLLVWLFTD